MKHECPCTPKFQEVICDIGIWGGKGQGKTFQCNLAFKKLGIAPIVMSAGELESGNAGEPAKLIRQRYREASDVIKKVGMFNAGLWGELQSACQLHILFVEAKERNFEKFFFEKLLAASMLLL